MRHKVGQTFREAKREGMNGHRDRESDGDRQMGYSLGHFKDP